MILKCTHVHKHTRAHAVARLEKSIVVVVRLI